MGILCKNSPWGQRQGAWEEAGAQDPWTADGEESSGPTSVKLRTPEEWCHRQLRAQERGEVWLLADPHESRTMLPGTTRTGDPRPRPSVSSGNTAVTVSASRRSFQANTSLASTRPEMRHRMGLEQCLCPPLSPLQKYLYLHGLQAIHLHTRQMRSS